MARTRDMTTGKPAGLLLSFALPLMAGNICQQLYTMVDTMVVGQVLGVEALASLGAADWLNWLVLGIIMGFTQGFSILISQRFGAEDQDGLRKVTAMSTLLSAVIAVVVTVSSLLLAEPVLRLLNTPDNVLPGSLSYLRIIFSGSVIVTAYNMMASILRAMGDSRTLCTPCWWLPWSTSDWTCCLSWGSTGAFPALPLQRSLPRAVPACSVWLCSGA